MPRRRRALPLAAVLALLVTGCAGSDVGSSAACAAPELTWAADSATAGEAIALSGIYMTSGCDDGSGGEAEVPLGITAATLLADGEPAGSPAIDGTLTASDDGTLDMQVALPPDLAEGTRVTVELTVTEGPPVVSDELTIGQ